MIHWRVIQSQCLNTLRPRQNGRHTPDDVFRCIFLNGNLWIWIKIPLKFVPEGPINNIAALVQIMAWRRPGDKPLSEPMMVSLLTHICVTRPRCVKPFRSEHNEGHFAKVTIKSNLFTESVFILIQISQVFVCFLKGAQFDNGSIWIKAWHRAGSKPLPDYPGQWWLT